MDRNEKRQRSNTALPVMTIIFLVSWVSIAIFGFFLVREYNKNAQLKKMVFALEKRTLYQTNEARRYQELIANANQLQENTLRYIQWQFVLKDQLRDAAVKFNEQIAKVSDLKKDKALLGLLHYNLGLCYTSAVEFEPALREFEEAFKLDPNNADSCYNLGLIYSAFRPDPKKVAFYYKRYLELAPSGSRVEEVKDRLKRTESP